MEDMQMNSVPVPRDLAADPRFIRAAPEMFGPVAEGTAPPPREGPMPAEAPPPGLRTGSVNQLREAVMLGLRAMTPQSSPRPIISEFTYRSGKHVRYGDVLEDASRGLARVVAVDSAGVVLNHVTLGEMRVGSQYLRRCLLVKRAKV